jgi:hypothetical protein
MLRSARVVFSEDAAKKWELEIDHDDSHAMKHGNDFALLIHGTQPAGTEASKAWTRIKAAGGGYSRRVPLTTV